MEGQALKGHLDMLVLAAVNGGATHGYAVIEALRRRSAGAFDLPEGTIYPVLHRLERRGLLGSRWAEQGRRRRVYRLTRAGRQQLLESRQAWDDFSRAVGLILEDGT